MLSGHDGLLEHKCSGVHETGGTSGLQFREIQNLIDEPKQVSAAVENIRPIFTLALAFQTEFRVLDDFGKADDGIKRGTQFMAHIGEKL